MWAGGSSGALPRVASTAAAGKERDGAALVEALRQLTPKEVDKLEEVMRRERAQRYSLYPRFIGSRSRDAPSTHEGLKYGIPIPEGVVKPLLRCSVAEEFDSPPLFADDVDAGRGNAMRDLMTKRDACEK
eukprot:1191356-Prorocentrum_minimum.AAC.3